MYQYLIPLMNDSCKEEHIYEYIRQLKAAEADRVLVAFGGLRSDPAEEDALIESLGETIHRFREAGVKPAVWVGSTIGHGTALSAKDLNKKDFGQPLVDITGRVRPGTRCPLDPDFRKLAARQIGRIAGLGVRTIFLDDDFRLSQHGGEFCCACDAHMHRINELCGERLTREELHRLAFTGKPNRYREAWLQAQGESLCLLAREIRAAVDATDPGVCVALCAAHCQWDIDGTTPLELTEILAGDNPPQLRLHGAPYWAAYNHYVTELPSVFEHERMFASFCRGKGIALYAEGDAYPRPRYNIPSSYLELFDAVMRADGSFAGSFKYMIDYLAPAQYETGYLERHMHNLPLLKRISQLFDGKRAVGVAVPTRPQLLKDADFSLGVASEYSPYPLASTALATCGLPTVHEEDGLCCALFGEAARHIDLEKLEKGAILDAVAAAILSERGVDTGLRSVPQFANQTVAALRSATQPDTIVNVHLGAGRFANAKMDGGCRMRLYATTAEGEIPFAYTYENANGQRFLTFLYDAQALPRVSGLHRGYLMQDLMRESAEWIGQAMLPAFCGGNPGMYCLCKAGEGSLAVGLFNCFADSVLKPVIRLGAAYREISFLNCSGKLEGDTVTLDAPIGAFEYVAFEVRA